MVQLTLTLQHTPAEIGPFCRVGINRERAVYLPVRAEGPAALALGRDDEAVWSDGGTELFVTPFPDRVEIRLVLHDRPDEGESGVIAEAA